jgi:hypothetical protein
MDNKKSLHLSPALVGLQLVLTFCLGLALRGTDPLHIVLSKIYPDEDSVGSLGIEMSDIPGLNPLNQHANFFIIRHEFDGEEDISIIRRGSIDRVEHLIAGINERNGTASIPQGGLNHSALVSIKMPPRVIVAAGILTALTSTERGHYFLSTKKFEKEFKGAGDLVVMTTNEVRNFRLLYWLSMFTLFLAGLGVSRFKGLTHPEETSSKNSPSESNVTEEVAM